MITCWLLGKGPVVSARVRVRAYILINYTYTHNLSLISHVAVYGWYINARARFVVLLPLQLAAVTRTARSRAARVLVVVAGCKDTGFKLTCIYNHAHMHLVCGGLFACVRVVVGVCVRARAHARVRLDISLCVCVL
jgi:hypothetical protein